MSEFFCKRDQAAICYIIKIQTIIDFAERKNETRPGIHTAMSVVFVDGVRKYVTMMKFSEFVQMREGLWLADKNALPGMSRPNLPPTTPKKKKIVGLPKTIQPIAKFPKPAITYGSTKL